MGANPAARPLSVRKVRKLASAGLTPAGGWILLTRGMPASGLDQGDVVSGDGPRLEEAFQEDGLGEAGRDLSASEYIRVQERRLESLQQYFNRTKGRLQKAALLDRMKAILAEMHREVERRQASIRDIEK